ALPIYLTERIAALRFDAGSALNHLSGARDVCAAAADQDLLGLLAPRARCEEELQRAAHLLTHVVDERSEHFGLVVAWQPTFLLGPPSFFHAEAVRAHHFFRQLLPTEGKVSRIDHFQIAQHAERRAARAEIDDCDDATEAAVGHLMSQQPAGVL